MGSKARSLLRETCTVPPVTWAETTSPGRVMLVPKLELKAGFGTVRPFAAEHPGPHRSPSVREIVAGCRLSTKLAPFALAVIADGRILATPMVVFSVGTT